jgi:anaerobic dimethyl sulfoxide reductase subunit A
MSEENFLSKALKDTVLTRRSFLKWSAALGGTAALAGGLSYGLKTAKAASEAAASQGEWMPVACWHNCGGRCLNTVLVKDGVVVRQKTDDTHPDSPDYPQQRGCARGRSQRHHVFGVDRIKYPMKRKNWEPGGGKKELRGIDEWERISWDEALDTIASELKRVKENYGNASFFAPRSSSRLLSLYGGYMDSWGVSSDGAWLQVQDKMSGGLYTAGDRMEYRKSKLIVLWNSNPIWSSGGNPTYNFLQAKKAGAKVIMVDPFFNDTAQALADEWIPVRPSTDAALLLGMAYHMIENGLQDQDFLDTYTVGFDRNHMPEGANPRENFKDYVLGTHDGVAKTPEWASEICGTPPDVIRKFAQEVATTKPMWWQASSSAARTSIGQQFCQAFLTVGWMTGNVGFPGAAVTHNYHSRSSYGGSSLVSQGGSGVPGIANPLAGGVRMGYGFADPESTEFQGVAYEEMWDAILTGEYTATVRGKLPCDIRLIWRMQDGNGGNSLNQVGGMTKGIQAFRKVDFVVTSDIVLSTVSKYADIVLPTTTPWEQEVGAFLTGNNEMILWGNKVTEPLYEARDCQWIERELAKRLDLDPDELYPISRSQQAYNRLAGAKVIKKDASDYEPLLTITADDIAELGVEGEPQRGRITLEELRTKGVYQVERRPGDAFTFLPGEAFRADPEANPVGTTTGKLEIHSQALADKIEAYGFITIPPIAQYNRPVEGIEDTYKDWDKKVKGDYPLQMVTIHYPRRSHSVFDNIGQLRRAFPQELMMNSLDAEARGLQSGDNALIESRHGKVLRPVYVTDRVMPGVIMLGEGAWAQVDEATGIDLAGATNTLNGAIPTGQGEEPWNSCNVQVSKWTGTPLVNDYKWEHRVPIQGETAVVSDEWHLEADVIQTEKEA